MSDSDREMMTNLEKLAQAARDRKAEIEAEDVASPERVGDSPEESLKHSPSIAIPVAGETPEYSDAVHLGDGLTAETTASAPQAESQTQAEPRTDGMNTDYLPADIAMEQWITSLPLWAQPYALLARWDRPIGIWLLAIPCWAGLFFARISTGLHWTDPVWLLWFLLGAAAMRGAGCTWNDIQDREIDAKVARTRGRPIPSGRVTVTKAYIWLVVQLLAGALVWIALPQMAKVIAIAALPLVIAYPFMKRFTWWPQAWLGLTFNWGLWVGGAVAGVPFFGMLFLYMGFIAWTIAYDTIYAMQDVEDDAMIGVKSTARLFGKHTILASLGFHILAALLIALAAWTQGAGQVGLVILVAFIGHAIWQAIQLKGSDGADALKVFKSNTITGLIVVGGFLLAALLYHATHDTAQTDTTPQPVLEGTMEPNQQTQ